MTAGVSEKCVKEFVLRHCIITRTDGHFNSFGTKNLKTEVLPPLRLAARCSTQLCDFIHILKSLGIYNSHQLKIKSIFVLRHYKYYSVSCAPCSVNISSVRCSHYAQLSREQVWRETTAEGENGISSLLIMDHNQTDDYRKSEY